MFCTEAWFLFLATSRWFAIRLDVMCAVFVTITAFGCLLLKDSKETATVHNFAKNWQIFPITRWALNGHSH